MTTTAPHIEIMRTVFPVLALNRELHGQAARPDCFGTAFAVAPNVFMTAAHVLDAASATGKVAIGGPMSGEGVPLMGAVPADAIERWPDCDIGLVFCNAPGVTILDHWLTKPVQVLTDLSTFGYPHAITPSPAGDRLNVIFRAYKGHVITTRGFDRLPSGPAVYEISVPFPEGLSGAPLLYSADNRLMVAGVVIGVETVTYGGAAHSVGVAMIADEIAGLHSERLKGNIAEVLGFIGVTVTFEPPA